MLLWMWLDVACVLAQNAICCQTSVADIRKSCRVQISHVLKLKSVCSLNVMGETGETTAPNVVSALGRGRWARGTIGCGLSNAVSVPGRRRWGRGALHWAPSNCGHGGGTDSKLLPYKPLRFTRRRRLGKRRLLCPGASAHAVGPCLPNGHHRVAQWARRGRTQQNGLWTSPGAIAGAGGR